MGAFNQSQYQPRPRQQIAWTPDGEQTSQAPKPDYGSVDRGWSRSPYQRQPPALVPQGVQNQQAGVDPGFNKYPPGFQSQMRTEPSYQTVAGDPRGALAVADPSQRPVPFQVGLSQTPWGQSADPFAERQKVIEQLNNQRMQRQTEFNRTSQDSSTPSWWNAAPQQLNMQQAVKGAGYAKGSPSLTKDGAAKDGTWVDLINRLYGTVPQPPALGGLFR